MYKRPSRQKGIVVSYAALILVLLCILATKAAFKGPSPMIGGRSYPAPEQPLFLFDEDALKPRGRGSRNSLHSRRLAATKLDVDGDYEGQCTQHCDPTGGFLSLVGALSGQCDCTLWQHTTTTGTTDANHSGGSKSEGGIFCKESAVTCCGVLDNGAGVVLYFLLVFYTFLGLAVVCDNYFCESLSRISTALQLSDDVAGATFMAAGSSAPELFTSLVTVLLTGGSEGLGTIAGSAVFNMMVITGATALAACSGEGSVLAVWWFPLSRDCLVYFVSMVELYVFMADSKITAVESLAMVGTYFVYVYVMKRNADLAAWASALDQTHREKALRVKAQTTQQAQSWNQQPREGGGGGGGIELAAMGGGSAIGAALRQAHGVSTPPPPPDASFLSYDASFLMQRATAGNPLHQPAFRSDSAGDHQRRRQRAAERLAFRREMATAVVTRRATSALMSSIGREAKWVGKGQGRHGDHDDEDGGGGGMFSLPPTADFDFQPSPPSLAAAGGGVCVNSGHAGDGDGASSPSSCLERVVSLLSLPLETLFACTVPDCTKPEYERYYVATFLMSILWIGALSFLMSDFAIRAGCVLGIPGLLMGLVFLAAGTSVPDALSSIAVGRSGLGDMAVANVLGSNIFNILLGLGLPWFLYTVVNGQPYALNPEEPLGVFMVVLGVYLLFFLATLYGNNWCLDARLGKLYFGGEVVFVVFACLITFVDLGI